MIRARCGVLWTLPVAFKRNRRFLSVKLEKTLVVLTLAKSTKLAILSLPTKTKMKRTKHSISIALLEMVFGESDGSVKSDSYFPVHLSGADF